MSEIAHRKRHVTLLAVLLLGGCVRQAEQEAKAPARRRTTAANTVVVSGVPISGYRDVDRRALERGRLDAAWLASATLDWQRRQRAAASPAPSAAPAPTAATGGEGVAPDAASTTGSEAAPIERCAPSRPRRPRRRRPRAAKRRPEDGTAGAAAPETWAGISPEAFTAFRPRLPIRREDGGPTVLALQQLLDRVRFSPGRSTAGGARTPRRPSTGCRPRSASSPPARSTRRSSAG